MKIKIIIIFLFASLSLFSQNDSIRFQNLIKKVLFITEDFYCDAETYSIYNSLNDKSYKIGKNISATQFVALKENDVFFYFPSKKTDHFFLFYDYKSDLQKKVFKKSNEYKQLLDSLYKIKNNNYFGLIFLRIPDYTIKKDFKGYPLNSFTFEYDIGYENKKIIEELYDNNYFFKEPFVKNEIDYFSQKTKFEYLTVPVPESIAIDIENNRDNIALFFIFNYNLSVQKVIFYDYVNKKIYFEK